MALFQILDCLEELERYGQVKHYSTWILATCPICQGKLKINKNSASYGAYACYTDECHKKPGYPIRQLLHRPTPFRQSTVFRPKETKRKALVEIIDEKPPTARPKDFLTDRPYTPPLQIKERNKVTTYFQYEGFRVVRLDTREADGSRRKYIFPEYSLPNGEFVKGLPTRLCSIPIYTSSYLQGAMVFGEGEKVATIGQKLGLATATFPSFAFSERYLVQYARELKSRGLTDVLYLEDNDVPGRKKAQLICNYFWKEGIGTKAVNLVEFFPEYRNESGFDLYDAFQQKLITPDNVQQVLDKCLELDKELTF